MYQNINLNFLKYYYEVANVRNITKASELLNISQPALTKALKEVEKELNTTLLIRNKKGVSLTEKGKILYEYTKVVLQKLQTTVNTINNPMDVIIKNDYEVINNLQKIKTFSIQDSFIASKKDFPELENKILTLDEILKYPFVFTF